MVTKRGFGKQISTYYLTEDQIQKMIDFAPDLRHRLLLRLLVVTAGRRFEVKSLLIEDIDWERNEIRLRRGKGGSKNSNDTPDKRRERPLDIGDTALLKDLREYIGRRTTGHILQSNSKKPGVDLSTINRMVKKCGILAGIKNPDSRKKWINPHLFRHTFGRAEEIELPVKQAVLGHRDAYTTMQMYGGLRTSDAIKRVREAREKKLQINNINKKEEQQNKSIFCKACGKNIDPDSKFCRYCGEKQ